MKIEKGGKIVPDSMGAAVAWASRAERKGGEKRKKIKRAGKLCLIAWALQ